MKDQRILAVSGSLRSGSTNTALLKAAAGLLPTGVELSLFSGLDALPHFNPDREYEDLPAVKAWREALKGCDALLISSPEYAHGIPGMLKNALDWVVGSGELIDKPVGILDTTSNQQGPSLSHQSLVETIRVMSAKVIPEAVVNIGGLRTKIDADGKLNDPAALESLRMVLTALAGRV